jgi:hypothetical protein
MGMRRKTRVRTSNTIYEVSCLDVAFSNDKELLIYNTLSCYNYHVLLLAGYRPFYSLDSPLNMGHAKGLPKAGCQKRTEMPGYSQNVRYIGGSYGLVNFGASIGLAMSVS